MGVADGLGVGDSDLVGVAFPRMNAFMQGDAGDGGNQLRTEALLPRVRNQQPFPRLQQAVQMQ